VVETYVLRPDNPIEYRGNKPVQLRIFILNGQHVEQSGGSSEKTTMIESVNLVGDNTEMYIEAIRADQGRSLYIFYSNDEHLQ
jgi:hypothetical protein